LGEWKKQFKFDPIPPLILTKSKALLYFIRYDLLEEDVGSIKQLWELDGAQKILKKQQRDGSWKYPGGKKDIYSQENYDQLETYRQLGFLVEIYGFKNTHSAIKNAAKFLFSFQTDEGDFRGIYRNQYSPNYTAGILELLIKAGYQNDIHIEKGLEWLLSVRQDDGGWAVPIRTNNAKWQEVMNSKEPLQPNRVKIFSYMITGVVLRAFAIHPTYQKSPEIKLAGELLLSRFFENDKYPDRRDKSYWTKFTFPFWFNDLLSSLDSLYFIGFTKEHPNIEKAIEWFKSKQEDDGNWNLKLLKGAKVKDYKLWISYLICRTFKRYFS